MQDIRTKTLVKPNARINLKHVNPDWHSKFKSHKSAKPEIKRHLEKMDMSQYLMYAENKHSLLIVLQGLDSAGKDGVIRHVLTGINPQGCSVRSFKKPNSEESSHDFLWRVHPHSPAKGMVSIFNRSHYEDVLITRVHDLVSGAECAMRYRAINAFEKLLIEENQTTILKFFLHISKDEQLNRFRKRLDDPARHWKISEGDYNERNYWDKYMEAYEELLRYTSTKIAPWFIIPSNHKWFRDLAISQIICSTFEEMKMKSPRATVDLHEIRRKYHKAEKDQKSARHKG